MTAFKRLDTGGRIDRSRTLTFTYDGQRLFGQVGDTLASALLANGKMVVGRSFKYHRPRGFLSAGIEEANGLFTIGEGNRAEPNIPGTMVPLADGLVAREPERLAVACL
jgi:NADPH-dependent 2,4-dienoyl-CoA reductase/sulfur reductase-like enzyme